MERIFIVKRTDKRSRFIQTINVKAFKCFEKAKAFAEENQEEPHSLLDFLTDTWFIDEVSYDDSVDESIVSDDSDNRVVKVVNLTPHDLNIYDGENLIETITPDERGPARCTRSQVQIGEINGVPIFTVKFGEVENLPEPEENTVYFVSLATANGAPDRTDLVCANEVLRDESGRPYGCCSFSKV